jgi:N-methylhydantoinase A/oxoprolinase/acetone carboxylase beta subunit
MRIGVDVGGTNTDAVLMDGSSVIGWYKSETTADISSGIVTAIRYLLDEAGCDPGMIENIMIGTTQFTNSLVEKKGLLEVAVLRLASPSGHSVEPKIGWPGDLKEAVGDHTFLLHGGYEFDGREVSAFDEQEVRRAAKETARRGLRAAAVSSTFASLNSEMEARAAAILIEENPGIHITLSSDIGRVGLYERENSTILNAALFQLSHQVVQSFRQALQELGICARFYISQNDGTLMKAEFVEKFPILTFASGPTNSMRGAAFLSGVENAIVMDIGGTTCDVGVLQHGFPRESSIDVDIGGVRTNFRMPDILAIGLGGGTIIHNVQELLLEDAPDLSTVVIGPKSVGYQLTEKALIFGGDTLTATDVAVATNPNLDIGDRQRVQHISSNLVSNIEEKIHCLCETALDRMKTSAGDMPVILVGGGHILIKRSLAGCSELIRPEHASVANAIGAAIAQVGGEIDHIYSYQKLGREQALADARQNVIDRVIQAGGDQDTLRFIDIDEVAINYLPGEAVRVKAKAVADLISGTSY